MITSFCIALIIAIPTEYYARQRRSHLPIPGRIELEYDSLGIQQIKVKKDPDAVERHITEYPPVRMEIDSMRKQPEFFPISSWKECDQWKLELEPAFVSALENSPDMTLSRRRAMMRWLFRWESPSRTRMLCSQLQRADGKQWESYCARRWPSFEDLPVTGKDLAVFRQFFKENPGSMWCRRVLEIHDGLPPRPGRKKSTRVKPQSYEEALKCETEIYQSTYIFDNAPDRLAEFLQWHLAKGTSRDSLQEIVDGHLTWYFFEKVGPPVEMKPGLIWCLKQKLAIPQVVAIYVKSFGRTVARDDLTPILVSHLDEDLKPEKFRDCCVSYCYLWLTKGDSRIVDRMREVYRGAIFDDHYTDSEVARAIQWLSGKTTSDLHDRLDSYDHGRWRPELREMLQSWNQREISIEDLRSYLRENGFTNSTSVESLLSNYWEQEFPKYQSTPCLDLFPPETVDLCGEVLVDAGVAFRAPENGDSLGTALCRLDLLGTSNRLTSFERVDEEVQRSPGGFSRRLISHWNGFRFTWRDQLYEIQAPKSDGTIHESEVCELANILMMHRGLSKRLIPMKSRVSTQEYTLFGEREFLAELAEDFSLPVVGGSEFFLSN